MKKMDAERKVNAVYMALLVMQCDATANALENVVELTGIKAEPEEGDLGSKVWYKFNKRFKNDLKFYKSLAETGTLYIQMSAIENGYEVTKLADWMNDIVDGKLKCSSEIAVETIRKVKIEVEPKDELD